jgi:hypothetical protein
MRLVKSFRDPFPVDAIEYRSLHSKIVLVRREESINQSK